MVQQVKAFVRGMEVREPQVFVARLSAPVYGEVECPVRVEHMQAMRLFVQNVYLVSVCLETGGVCYRFFRVGQGDEAQSAVSSHSSAAMEFSASSGSMRTETVCPFWDAWWQDRRSKTAKK